MRDLFFLETRHPPEVDEAYHVLNLGAVGYVLYWFRYLEMVKHVTGAIVECGVGRGRSLLVLSALNRLLEPDEGGGRDIYAYDSFEGFPEPSPEDDSRRAPKAGEWSYSPSGKYKYEPEFLRQILVNANLADEAARLKLCKGFFAESLKSYPNEHIAVLHIDGDLYESYRDVLAMLYGHVAPGGLIVFDDFTYRLDPDEKWPGARQAVAEFFEGKGQTMRESIRGTPYILKS